MRHNGELSDNGVYYRGQEHGDQLLYVCGDLVSELRTRHIHVVIRGGDAWNNYLNFRDYMNCHREEAKACARLKEKLAKRFPGDRGAYTAGKRDFIEDIPQKAAAWRESLCETSA